jgi:hypothetical protein
MRGSGAQATASERGRQERRESSGDRRVVPPTRFFPAPIYRSPRGTRGFAACWISALSQTSHRLVEALQRTEPHPLKHVDRRPPLSDRPRHARPSEADNAEARGQVVLVPAGPAVGPGLKRRGVGQRSVCRRGGPSMLDPAGTQRVHKRSENDQAQPTQPTRESLCPKGIHRFSTLTN